MDRVNRTPVAPFQCCQDATNARTVKFLGLLINIKVVNIELLVRWYPKIFCPGL